MLVTPIADGGAKSLNNSNLISGEVALKVSHLGPLKEGPDSSCTFFLLP